VIGDPPSATMTRAISTPTNIAPIIHGDGFQNFDRIVSVTPRGGRWSKWSSLFLRL
jgi:hypothetical protein